MDKEKLLGYLKEEIKQIKTEEHNEYTRMWSKGFLRGALFIFKLIKNWEE